MNSEFPMSFIEEQPPQKKNTAKHKSNVVALSRPQDSMMNSSSTMESDVQHNRSPQDYALSQFDDSSSSGRQQSNPSRGRLFVRGTLLAVLAGLWVAIGTGHLHSETSAMVQIRALLPAQFNSMNNSAEVSISQPDNSQSTTQPSEFSNEMTAAVSSSSMPAASSEAVTSHSPEATTSSSSNSPSVAANTSAAVVTSSVTSTNNDAQSAVKNPVSPIPEEQGETFMSEADVRKTLKMLRQQQQQLLDFQDHMSKLIAGMDQNAVLDQELKELEEQHLQAAKMLKDRRAKLRQ